MNKAVYNFRWLWLTVVLTLIPVCRAANQTPLNSLRQITQLTNAEANEGIPVTFLGTVTYYQHGNIDLFIQDGDAAIYVETSANGHLSTGDQVLVIGTTRGSFRPEVKSDKIMFIRHGAAPPPVNADFRQLIRAELDCRRATIRGKVRSANRVLDAGLPNIYLQILMDGGIVDAEMAADGPTDLSALLDAEVEVTGAVAGKFDSKMQMTGILLEVQSFADVKVIKQADVNPRSLPFTPMDEVVKAYLVEDRTQRVRVQGTVTYYEPGVAVVLQDGAKSLWLKTRYEQPIRIGDFAEATGFPNVENGALTLTSSEIHDSGRPSHSAPYFAPAADLATGNHSLDLVSTEGHLLSVVREAAQDEYVLVANGQLFSAILKHPRHGADLKPGPMKTIALGSTVLVTGICVLETADKTQGPVAFAILARSPDDVTLIKGPTAFNVRNLSYIIGALLLVLSVVGLLAWRTERRARKQDAHSAGTEQLRSRILEDINGTRPLMEIIEEITEMASFRLSGAPCWCELNDGRLRGSQPESRSHLRTVNADVLSGSGTSLARVSAAFPLPAKAEPVEQQTLSVAAGLIALAIENRRLISDLQHRSEFDVLTDTRNRYSFEKYVTKLIELRRKENAQFGIIYVDLDGFKLINDTYGHQIGDRFLQLVSRRIQRHLRQADILARLGGDEFAIAIADAASKEEIQLVISRLEACFEEPFLVDGNRLAGAASIGFSMFPLDGSTTDSLLNSADAAMYIVKHARRRRDVLNSASGSARSFHGVS